MPEIVHVAAFTTNPKVFDDVPRLAVSVAVNPLDTVNTVAVKVPVVWPAVTVMFAGTVTLALLLERPTVVPPVGAAELSVTVQVEEPGEFTGELHDRPLTVCIVTLPPRLDAEICDPFTSTATGFEIPIAAEPAGAADATVKLTFAMIPLVTTPPCVPDKTHSMLPEPDEQVTAVFAADAAAPVVTTTPEKSAAGYVMVHWIPLGCAPPEVVTDRLNPALPPSTAVTELSDKATC